MNPNKKLNKYEIYPPNKGIIEEVIKRLVDRDPQLIERLGKHEVLLNWMGGFRVKGFYAAHEIAFDMPSIVGGSDAHPGPGPTLLASLGACLAIGVVYNSVVKDVKLHRLSVRIIGTKGDPRTFYIGSGGNPGYDNIHVIFYIETDASDEVMKNIIEHSIKTSPVASSLRARITYELKLLKKG